MAATRVFLHAGPLAGFLKETDQRCQVFTTDRDFLVYRRKGRGVIPLLAPF